MTVHTCDAIIVCCIDFRFQKYIRDWIDKQLLKKLKWRTYDLVGFAGATKDLKTVFEQIKISVRLHQVRRVILIHHEDCGAYGEQSTPERHAQDLRNAKNKILTTYPQLEVELYYLRLDGQFEKIGDVPSTPLPKAPES